MIEINKKIDCCGCNACGDVCAHQAITFKTDNEGFWYPEVDKSKCTDCHLCEKVCPIINIKELKKNDLPQSVCYAAEHKNIEVVFDSTSGGLFSALADMMYKNEGYVGGAVFNEDMSVSQYISNDKNDLPRLRSSKYLQSHFDGFYKQVRGLLTQGNKVLVCGSPCQMAALRAFLRKDYDNLIIVDYVCRGINSPKVWRKYLDSFEERYGSPVVYAKAKSKEYGWRNLTQKVILKNGKTYYETKEQSNFTKGYLRTNAYCRPSCYECKFKGYPRISDISLADFWGIEKIAPAFEKNLGTSLVMINSKKGESFFESIKNKINFIPVSLQAAEAGNGCLNDSLPAPKVDRIDFFKDLDQMTFTQLAEKYINPGDVTWKSKLKWLAHYAWDFVSTTQLRPMPVLRFFRYNSLKDIWQGKVLITAPYTIIKKSRKGKIVKNGIAKIGVKRYPTSRVETRILVEPGAVLTFGGNNNINYGADIEVFANANLTIGKDTSSNIGATIICGNSIQIGNGVKMGRNVTIRDNNGNHYIARQGYKTSRPVVIGDKVWLTEQCTVMPGVKIGDGAIISALSLVIRNIPAFSLASGHPAEVIDEDIIWKF